MIHIALYQPEIPPNTGNIIRLCANSGAQLHLIHPLGFALDDKKMRRAGLDYHEWTHVQHYDNLEHFLKANATRRIIACETSGQQYYHEVQYQEEDILLFGRETTGLPTSLLEKIMAVKIPMRPHSRSLNLSNSVAIVLFEAWRQLDFSGADLS